MIERKVHLVVSEPAFLVIFKLLENVRLGDRNVFESAISDLMAAGYEETADMYNEGIDRYGEPSIGFEYNDNEGAVINITEA